MQRDHDTREAMLDAYYLHYWDELQAWRWLVDITEKYTKEDSGV